MSGSTEPIAEYGDLISDPSLSDDDVDAIARTLKKWGGGQGELVFWLPEWLSEKKDIEQLTVDGTEQVLKAVCDTETEKAWCASRSHLGEDPVWLPKSVCRAFSRARPTTSISIPHQREGSR